MGDSRDDQLLNQAGAQKRLNRLPAIDVQVFHSAFLEPLDQLVRFVAVVFAASARVTDGEPIDIAVLPGYESVEARGNED